MSDKCVSHTSTEFISLCLLKVNRNKGPKMEFYKKIPEKLYVKKNLFDSTFDLCAKKETKIRNEYYHLLKKDIRECLSWNIVYMIKTRNSIAKEFMSLY